MFVCDDTDGVKTLNLSAFAHAWRGGEGMGRGREESREEGGGGPFRGLLGAVGAFREGQTGYISALNLALTLTALSDLCGKTVWGGERRGGWCGGVAWTEREREEEERLKRGDMFGCLRNGGWMGCGGVFFP